MNHNHEIDAGLVACTNYLIACKNKAINPLFHTLPIEDSVRYQMVSIVNSVRFIGELLCEGIDREQKKYGEFLISTTDMMEGFISLISELQNCQKKRF
ncbi:TPA: hypothetical protein ACH9TN_002685 [Escherichia coli]|nr:hypothetical protein [Escherichia coli]HAU7908876.1 hypothetical protein [Escherichia coli]HCK2126801.1 hypothetical protein [Escherichia coli]